MSSEIASTKRITAGKQLDAEGNPKAFVLKNGPEQITLDPGKTWAKLDVFKWVTRGLIEEPQGFHVLTNGAVQIHSQTIELADPKGPTKLEEAINQRSPSAAPPPKPARPAPASHTPGESTPKSNKVQFKIRLDHLGHLMVECLRGPEKVETGIRGLPNLVRNGLMLKPKSIHLDPLLTYAEIDGVRFDSNPAGAEALQNFLNASYAPALQGEGDTAIEIRDNPAAATGFDIHFVTVRAGARFEVKGHLCQEYLDILQDQAKCQLLRPGTVLRLSPPYLIFRRRRPDSSEEKIPELPDLQYRRVTAAQLQQILNHPLLRRADASAPSELVLAPDEVPPDITEFRLTRNPQSKVLLWLEIATTHGSHGKAFTHHNVADLQHAGVFRPNLDVVLSLDNRTLSILNTETQQEDRMVVEYASSDADLEKAASVLTAALKPCVRPPDQSKSKPSEPAQAALPIPQTPASAPVESPVTSPVAATVTEPLAESPPARIGRSESVDAISRPGTAGAASETVVPPPRPQRAENGAGSQPLHEHARNGGQNPGAAVHAQEASASAAAMTSDPPVPALKIEEPPPAEDPAIRALFCETDPLRINVEVFRALESCLEVSTQHLELSLERVFHNRRFEVLSFTHPEITSVLEIRSDEFVGFYLTYVNERKVLLDYANQGKRVEWGPEKCCLQTSVTADPEEFKGSALLGMAVTEANQFVFIVTPGFKQWVKPLEKIYQAACASFATVSEIAMAPDKYTLLWPAAA